MGAVVSLEASRLARNGRDWHTLLEFCGLVGTLIVDQQAIYDPRSPYDRLLLGMKGTMSEMELSVFRQRSVEAMRQKARRGELHLTVAVGYLKTDDARVRQTADRVGSFGLSHPSLHPDKPGLRRLLAYGRRGARVMIKDGRKRVIRDTLRRNSKDLEVLIHGHHEGYISWAEFERNQHLVAENANGKATWDAVR